MRIDIPEIYDEGILGFIHQNGDIIFKYKDDDIIEIVFKYVYR